jgi:uroporphyrinogen-III decarboxylase
MGFNEGLVAMAEEPESVKELLNFMCDWYVPIVEKSIEYYKPDLLSLGDDTASKYSTFFSVQMYRDIFKPIYSRLTKLAQERDIMVEFHNCGKCEAFIPEMIDFGVHYWNPAQTDNDLVGIKAKYKNFAIVGGWDFVPNPEVPITEDLVKSSVRESIDKYAPGGGYAFLGGYLGQADQAEEAAQVNKWVSEEAEAYGSTFYDK